MSRQEGVASCREFTLAALILVLLVLVLLILLVAAVLLILLVLLILVLVLLILIAIHRFSSSQNGLRFLPPAYHAPVFRIYP